MVLSIHFFAKVWQTKTDLEAELENVRAEVLRPPQILTRDQDRAPLRPLGDEIQQRRSPAWIEPGGRLVQGEE